ncbi:ribosomal protein S2, conserved site [Rhypophila decipiens]
MYHPATENEQAADREIPTHQPAPETTERIMDKTDEEDPKPTSNHDLSAGVSTQTLPISRVQKTFRLATDLTLLILSLLFIVYGALVASVDGHLATEGSTGLRLFEVSQYAPTVFPILFAAIAGGTLKSMATWRIQTNRGMTLGLVEQCLGSQTLFGAAKTHIMLRAVNLFGLVVVVLWCLSPLGGQASLRVISVESRLTSTSTPLSSLSTFSHYLYVGASGASAAQTQLLGPVIASILGAGVLANQNQDLWGNIRFPAIENLKEAGTDWLDIPPYDNLTFPPLVGTPVIGLPSSGNTSFTLPGSYLSISCPIFGRTSQTSFSNFTNGTDAGLENLVPGIWHIQRAGSQYQIAISRPPPNESILVAEPERYNARKLVWESQSHMVESDTQAFTRAECHLSTTHLDANVTCAGKVTQGGSSSGSICDVISVRRSLSPPFPRNWTVLDLSGTPLGTENVLSLLAAAYSLCSLTCTNPFKASMGSLMDGKTPALYTIDSTVFQTRLEQMLNSLLYLGISVKGAFTGDFNRTKEIETVRQQPAQVVPVLNLTGITTTQQNVVRCHWAWLSLLLLSSSVMFLCALAGLVLRAVTLAPDVLGSMSMILLSNRIEGVAGGGSSAWSQEKWARMFKDKRLFLGDAEPGAELHAAVTPSRWPSVFACMKAGFHFGNVETNPSSDLSMASQNNLFLKIVKEDEETPCIHPRVNRRTRDHKTIVPHMSVTCWQVWPCGQKRSASLALALTNGNWNHWMNYVNQGGRVASTPIVPCICAHNTNLSNGY